VGHKFGSSQSHVLVVFQNALKWPKWNLQHVRSFCFRGRFPSLSPHFYLFWSLMDVPSICHLQHRSHCFWTFKTTQKLAFFPLYSTITSRKWLSGLYSYLHLTVEVCATISSVIS
jgi:hypothetical protein